MNNPGPSKVMKLPESLLNSEDTDRGCNGCNIRARQPTIPTPGPVSLDRINHPSQDDGEEDVTIEVAPLSNCS